MLERLSNLITPPATPARGLSRVIPLIRNAPPAVEQRSALLAGKNITYTLKRSKRRSIGLRIDDRGLTVCVPVRASEKWLHSVLQEKAGWVLEKLEGWRARKPVVPCWCDGGVMELQGEALVLRVARNLFASPPERRGGELWVFVVDDKTALIEQMVKRWYQGEALKLFEQRVAHYAPLLEVAPRAVKLSAATAQWGSCTVQGVVRLNVQLIRLPLRLIDYVVAHELAHLREMNHSANFWRVVGNVCADHANLRRELRTFTLNSEILL